MTYEVDPMYCMNCGAELDVDEQYEVECWPCRSRAAEEKQAADTEAAGILMRYHYAQTQSN